MQANPKPSETPEATPAEPAAGPGPAEGAAAHLSPARALQARLAKELVAAPGRSWPWHSAGLVLTTILAIWFAGLVLSAGL